MASLRRWAELPHVFLKHKNEKTHMETTGKRDMGKKKGRQLQGEGWRWSRDAGSEVARGLTGWMARWWWTEVFAGIFPRTAIFFSLSLLSRAAVAVCFLPPPSQALPFSFFYFGGWLNWLKSIVLAERLRRAWVAEQPVKILFFIGLSQRKMDLRFQSEFLKTYID